MALLNLSLNGRFTTQFTSGVQRFAHNMGAALCDIARTHPDLLSMELIAPAKAEFVSPPEFEVPIRRGGRLSGHAWEQLELPRLCAGRTLFSPCNTGPLATRDQVVTIHDAQVYLTPESYSRVFGGWYRFLLPRLARRVGAVTTDSEFSRAQLRRFKVLPENKGLVIHAAADHVLHSAKDEDILTRHGLARGSFLLAIGSLSPHKNIRSIIDAMARTQATTPLVVAGGQNHAVFAEAGLAGNDRVHFIGRVSDAELRSLYENAACLLFPSFYEGFGLPPLEAMSFGCPVIASTGGSIPEICGDAAILLPPDDIAGWARAIDALLADPDAQTELRRKGAARAAAFTWRNSARALVNALLAERGAALPERDA